MMLLENKTALITGASRGIGKAIAMKFAGEGASIAFTYLKSNDAAQQTKAELESLGVRVLAIASDSSDFAGAQDVVNQVLAEFSKLDILVNNSGITKDGLMMRMSEEQWDQVIGCAQQFSANVCKSINNYVSPEFGREMASLITQQ